jgi:hypothetical protein
MVGPDAPEKILEFYPLDWLKTHSPVEKVGRSRVLLNTATGMKAG